MARAEDAPDSPSRMAALAAVVDRRAAADPEFKSQVQRLVELDTARSARCRARPLGQDTEELEPSGSFPLAASVR